MRGTASARRAAAVFYIVNVLLFPITLIGYVIWLTRIYMVRRAEGASITAQGPLSARWTMHRLGLRRDDAAYRLLMALPSTSGPALLLTAGPMLLAHRLTGYVPSAFRYPFEGDVPPQFEASARVTFIDAAVERYLATISQFVILGAGFDTRAFRLPRPGQIRCFEVDLPQTQASKRQLLHKAGIDSTFVTLVAADFETEDWLARLVEAGFDPNQPAVFLWEGVIMYLDRQAVESTLRKIATTAKGSVLVFDYFTIEPLRSRTVYCVSAEPRPKPLANRSASGSTAHRHRAIDSPSCSRPVGWAWPRSARSARRRTAGGPGPALRSRRWPPSR